GPTTLLFVTSHDRGFHLAASRGAAVARERGRIEGDLRAPHRRHRRRARTRFNGYWVTTWRTPCPPSPSFRAGWRAVRLPAPREAACLAGASWARRCQSANVSWNSV